MKNKNRIVSGLALLALALSATQSRAPSTGIPYNFSNFAGRVGPGNMDGTGGRISGAESKVFAPDNGQP